jgi:hypothetical protein
MKIMCFDTDYCGYQQNVLTAQKEYPIDLSSKFVRCPSCMESIAIIEDDDFVLQKSSDKTQQINDFVSLLEKLIKM